MRYLSAFREDHSLTVVAPIRAGPRGRPVSKRSCQLATAIGLLCAMLGCRTSTVTHAVDPEAASCIPSDTLVLAGVNLDRLRAAPLYSKLPAAAMAMAGAFTDASSALLAYNGKDLLVIAR